jgi:hypothetical protein
MIQHFRICNLDKKEFIDPATFNEHASGSRISDCGTDWHNTLNFLTTLLHDWRPKDQKAIAGHWAGDRVVVANSWGSPESDAPINPDVNDEHATEPEHYNAYGWSKLPGWTELTASVLFGGLCPE